MKSQILDTWKDDKVIVCIGARQVGKSTLISDICSGKGDYLYINGDDPEIHALLHNAGEKRLQQLIGSHKIVFIDEAQRIENIGLIAKIIFDRLKNVKLLISGSSALEISSKINEPLTGRKWEYHLWPICWSELSHHFGLLDALTQLENRIIYGMYPEVVLSGERTVEKLKQLAGSYLYKDVLNIQNIKKPEVLQKLLHALALQVGNEVNYNELSKMIGVDRRTIEEYIGLLEKTFIIFKLSSFNRNERTEISKGKKIYFYDNGIRNAIIGDFRALPLRQDTGNLWENFIISELRKKSDYAQVPFRDYFWRTFQQQEIDYVLEQNGKITAFEIKWNSLKKVKFPQTFTNNYPNAETYLLDKENFFDFL